MNTCRAIDSGDHASPDSSNEWIARRGSSDEDTGSHPANARVAGEARTNYAADSLPMQCRVRAEDLGQPARIIEDLLGDGVHIARRVLRRQHPARIDEVGRVVVRIGVALEQRQRIPRQEAPQCSSRNSGRAVTPAPSGHLFAGVRPFGRRAAREAADRAPGDAGAGDGAGGGRRRRRVARPRSCGRQTAREPAPSGGHRFRAGGQVSAAS